jgi:hypothetical protein
MFVLSPRTRVKAPAKTQDLELSCAQNGLVRHTPRVFLSHDAAAKSYECSPWARAVNKPPCPPVPVQWEPRRAPGLPRYSSIGRKLSRSVGISDAFPPDGARIGKILLLVVRDRKKKPAEAG